MDGLRRKLELQHDELRGHTAELSRTLRSGDVAAAMSATHALLFTFRRSVREVEERVLPRLEELTGVGALSRASAARSEHRVLLDLLRGLERAVARGDLSVAAIDLREVDVTLELHWKKECNIADLVEESDAAASI
jgi:hypothetical protein